MRGADAELLRKVLQVLTQGTLPVVVVPAVPGVKEFRTRPARTVQGKEAEVPRMKPSAHPLGAQKSMRQGQIRRLQDCH